MPIIYGLNSARLGEYRRFSNTFISKSFTTHAEKSEVFLSYYHSDRSTALTLARALDEAGRYVYIDVHDDSLDPGDSQLDQALVTAINNSDTMVVVVSDETQLSWWVPWEIGVSTPFWKPRAIYKVRTSQPLPIYLQKLRQLGDHSAANRWILENKSGR